MKRTRAALSPSRADNNVCYSEDSEDIENLSTDCSQDGNDDSRYKKGMRSNPQRFYKAPYKFCETFKEDHGKNLFAVQFNQHSRDQLVFATAGANRVSIYECLHPNGIKLLRMYTDPAEDECFYSLSWSYHDKDTPVIAVAGKRAVIRIIYPTSLGFSSDELSYTGHGHAINHLTFNHTKPHILLSASKDHDMRLWNIKTHTCLAVLGGVEGHTDEVLYAEFSLDGNRIVSCGMDHYLKLWNLDKAKTKAAMEHSSKYDKRCHRAFPVHRDHFPVFSTRDIHNNYIDCVLDFGKFIISKSCENEVVLWRPGTIGEPPQMKQQSNKNCVTVITKLPVKDTEIWFLRVSLDRAKKNMALGNLVGKIYLWDLDVDDPKKIRTSILQHVSCTTAIRQTSFSPDSKTLVACCDDGSVWRWNNPSKS